MEAKLFLKRTSGAFLSNRVLPGAILPFAAAVGDLAIPGNTGGKSLNSVRGLESLGASGVPVGKFLVGEFPILAVGTLNLAQILRLVLGALDVTAQAPPPQGLCPSC